MLYRNVEAVLLGEYISNGIRVFLVRSEYDWGQEPAKIFHDGDKWLCTSGTELSDDDTFVLPIKKFLNQERIKELGVK
jgi:hypothetical protein